MNVAGMVKVERGCADCLLRAMNLGRVLEPETTARDDEPENALERQLEQLERSFGTNWKW
jgi:hypothetical protein